MPQKLGITVGFTKHSYCMKKLMWMIDVDHVTRNNHRKYTNDYSLLQHSNVQWLCCRCQTLTFRSFKTSPSFYEPVANENITPESLSPTFNPLFTSSPKSHHQTTDNPAERSNTSPNYSKKAKSTKSSSRSSSFDIPQKKNLRVMSVNCYRTVVVLSTKEPI